MKHTVLLILMSFLFIQCISVKQKVKSAPKTTTTSMENVTTSKPKLVVGIVVDQMRYDYLTRFKEKYGEGGFMRMLQEGYNCKIHITTTFQPTLGQDMLLSTQEQHQKITEL